MNNGETLKRSSEKWSCVASIFLHRAIYSLRSDLLINMAYHYEENSISPAIAVKKGVNILR